MLFPRFTAGLAGLALVASTPLAVRAQVTPPAVPDSVQALMTEFQTLQQRLQQTQAQALQGDTALQTEQTELQEAIQAAIIEGDPVMEAKIDSLPQLQQEAAAAQQSGDNAELQNLMAAGQRLQASIQEAQAVVVEEDEDVAGQVEAFRAGLMTAMEGIDSDIGTVVDRLDELAEQLNAIQGGGVSP